MEVHPLSSEEDNELGGTGQESAGGPQDLKQKWRHWCQGRRSVHSCHPLQVRAKGAPGTHHLFGLSSPLLLPRHQLRRRQGHDLGILNRETRKNTSWTYQYHLHYKDPVNSVNYDHQGRYLVSCSSDLSIRLWDCNNDYQCFKTLNGHNHNVSFATFNP